jgi:colanic acid/amylovoran biosynthesis glycosyltransferase
MGRVAIFSTQFLPVSQAFVFEELRQHARFRADVFARRRLFAEHFPYERVHVAGPLYGLTRRSPLFDKRFRELGFDLVHAHFGTGAVYGLRWAERFDLPLVVSFHGHDVTRLCSGERYLPSTLRYALLSRRLFSRMTLGLCASSELRDLLHDLGVPASKLRVHRLGVDLSLFAKGERPAGTLQVAMVVRLQEKKGFGFGLRAFAAAARERPALQLTVAGEGPLERELRSLARELRIGKQVRFTGALPPGEVARLLSQTHVLLAPSVVARDGDRDSGLLVAKEASASEAVPIGSRHGGIPDIIDDGVTGYLVAERDEDALADRLKRLADDPALRERMGRAAREKMVREYDNRECVARLEGHYDHALRVFAHENESLLASLQTEAPAR